MERLEPETEIHRTQKALKALLGRTGEGGDVLFPESSIQIEAPEDVVCRPGGQLALALIVNLMARMKAIVSTVAVDLPYGIERHGKVPLPGNDLREGLEQLVSSLSGPESEYDVTWRFDTKQPRPTVSVALSRKNGDAPASDVVVGAGPWTAFINMPGSRSNWSEPIPVGPHMAATFGVAEVFKQLLMRNYPEQTRRPVKLLENTAFCALTYEDKPLGNAYLRADARLDLDRMGIVGLGAGGTAALYTLASYPHVDGAVTLIEPANHKKSNLARYPLSNYEDCAYGTSKVEVAGAFLRRQAADLIVQEEDLSYADVRERDFRLVLSTVDTPEARWDIQRDSIPIILDAAVVESIYALLRVYPGEGMCLACKHPYDPDITWKRRARMWGKQVDTVRRMYVERAPVTVHDISVLAEVQGRSVDDFAELEGLPFDQVPALTECGQTHLDLREPNQVATLPFVATMAGVLLAAEVIKERLMPEAALRNWFDHDMLWVPKTSRHRFRPPVSSCQFCSPNCQ